MINWLITIKIMAYPLDSGISTIKSREMVGQGQEGEQEEAGGAHVVSVWVFLVQVQRSQERMKSQTVSCRRGNQEYQLTNQ